MTDLEKAAFKYFLLLSRFEYALKNSGYLHQGRGNAAQPDWEHFIQEIVMLVEIPAGDTDIEYLKHYPPKKQLFLDDLLGWSTPDPIGSDKRRLIEACLTIRNNLFHGGKHNDNEFDRNIRLLNAANKILMFALRASTAETKRAFKDARL